MTSKLFALNIIFAVFDVLLGLSGIALFAWAAWFFCKWWLTLFALMPLALYNSHSLIIDDDIEAAQKGGEQDGNSET